jgi:hypothetical protein
MSVEPSARALVTVEEAARLLGGGDLDLGSEQTVNTLRELINEASAYVHLDTGREFVWPAELYETSEERTFSYTPGYPTQIGDVQEVISLELNGVAVNAADYLLLPSHPSPGEPFTAVQFGPGVSLRTPAWPSYHYPSDVLTIDAVWGWPAVPDAVKRACKLIVEAWYPLAGQVTSDTFDDLSPVPGITTVGAQSRSFAIPLAAEQILSRYRRVNVI